MPAISNPVVELAGVKYPGTQVSSSDANVLDDYVEGTWTPSFSGGSNCSSVVATRAVYTKIGRLVYLQMNGTLTVTATTTETFFVTTLPFAQGANGEMSIGMAKIGTVYGAIEDNTSGNATEGFVRVASSSGTGSQNWTASLVYHAAT